MSYLLPWKGLLTRYQRHAFLHKLMSLRSSNDTICHTILFLFLHWVWRSVSGISNYVFLTFSHEVFGGINQYIDLVDRVDQGSVENRLSVINTITTIGSCLSKGHTLSHRRDTLYTYVPWDQWNDKIFSTLVTWVWMQSQWHCSMVQMYPFYPTWIGRSWEILRSILNCYRFKPIPSRP